jgi:CRP-like cAMP-binding protein
VADYARFLTQVPLFAGMSEAHLRRIVNSTHERHFDPGTPIVSEGETGQGFYLITAGRADVQRRGRTLRTLEPGDYFGELALLRDQPRSATVIAKERTTCLALTRWDFKGILEANPAIAVQLLEAVASRVHDEDSR